MVPWQRPIFANSADLKLDDLNCLSLKCNDESDLILLNELNSKFFFGALDKVVKSH